MKYVETTFFLPCKYLTPEGSLARYKLGSSFPVQRSTPRISPSNQGHDSIEQDSDTLRQMHTSLAKKEVLVIYAPSLAVHTSTAKKEILTGDLRTFACVALYVQVAGKSRLALEYRWAL